MRISSVLILLLIATVSQAQDPIPPANLEGEELRDWLKVNWHSPWHNDLGYDQARIQMFGNIDASGGEIECVYSGYDQGAGFVTYPNPINTEHTIPQSFFDSNAPMKNDLHHLYPTHGQANSTRGNLPYGEANDNQTDEWIYSNGNNYQNGGNTPSSNIDDYSEVIHNQVFEPREEKKGNTARAIFYFYTMYPDDLESAFDDISAAGDLATLYAWHVMDPPDAQEIARDEEIQALQGNYNPYIRMPELAAPAWGFVNSVSEYTLPYDVLYLGNEIIIESIELIDRIELLDMRGRLVRTVQHNTTLDMSGIGAAGYLLRVISQDGQTGVKKICYSPQAD